MTVNARKNGWLPSHRNSLVRMRHELPLTDAEIAAIERGVAALDQLAAEFEFDDSCGERFAHHQATRSARPADQKEIDMTQNNRMATNSSQILRWFGLLVAIGPVHMAEQMISGLDTLDELRVFTSGYYSYFTNPDIGTVTLVILIVTFVQLLVLATLAGGRWRLSVAAFFGFMGLVETHHIVQTVVRAAYFPGVITSIAYVWFGVMILRCVKQEWPAAETRYEGRRVAA